MTEQGPVAGWYPHPSMAGTQRYWDGSKWTDYVAPGAPLAIAPAPANGQMIIWGYVLAVFLPLIGFIIGIVALAKGEKHGIGIMVVAVSVFALVLSLNTNY